MSVAAIAEIPSLRFKVSDVEWETRVNLAAAYRLAEMHGWVTTIIYNHISARIPGTEHFLLNPLGLRYDEVTASNLVKIDLDGNILDDTPYTINDAGYTIHSAIHGARHDVNCVIHTHSVEGAAISALEDGLMFTNQDAMMFYGTLAYHDFEGIALELDERERLTRDLGDNLAMILRNHGLLTCGRTIGEAWVLMYFLEKACRSQVMLMSTGGKILQPSENLLRHTFEQFKLKEKPMGGREWPALVRMLDAKDRSYRQ